MKIREYRERLGLTSKELAQKMGVDAVSYTHLSMVAYCLSITDVDPMKYCLYFERFLNPERVTMPDIDIDFCIRRRQEVIEYVQNKYGADHVAQIVTFGTMAARGAIRDVGRCV